MVVDGEVKIDTKLDTSGVDKGVNDLKKKLNDAGKQIDDAGKKTKNLNTNLGGISKGAVAAAGAVAGVAVAVKKTVDALNDCERAYEVQRKAEIALQTAAKNNPYLNNESVYNLRQYASELQSLSNIGDEVSLQVMAQLAAAGRNEQQIMQIMQAAADMAAVTGEDIASAATKLNATLNGNAGTLGRQIESINNLTKEELEAGKAIELVAQQYKGGAAAMADQTVQLSNAWGDFKENIGRGWSRVTNPVKKFFTDILNDMNEALGKTADLKDANAAAATGSETSAQAKLRLDEAQALLDKLDESKKRAEEISQMTDKEIKKTPEYAQFTTWSDSGNPLQDFKNQQKEILNSYQKQEATVTELATRYNELKKAEEDEAAAAKKAADDAAAAADKKAKAEQRDKEAADYIAKNRQALAERLSVMQLEADLTGEAVDAGEIYNAYLSSYIELVTKSNGLVTEGNSAAKERLALLEQWATKAKAAADAQQYAADAVAEFDAAAELLKSTQGLGDNSIYDNYINRENELLKLKDDINKNEVLSERQKADEILKIDEELAKNRRTLWEGVASEVNGYAQIVQGMIDDAAKMALDTSNNEMKAELANLEIKYRKGELGEEEYQKKVAEAKKKGAKLQYQIELAQWSANVLSATANTAVGVTQALAQGGVAGIITGALVGAAGAVQLASIMAAKPIQHFATGGFVGGMNGASMGADNTTIAARAGEMVVNANQQRALWDMLNGNGAAGGAGGVNVVINNSAANLVSAQPQITRNQIELMIDARVNDGLRNGRFDGGLNAANAGMSGEYFGM